MTRKILVVEDTPILAENILDILRMEGYSVVCVTNGLLGIEVLQKDTISLIITDLVMPEMDGLTFTKQVRSQPEIKEIPIIILSAKTDSVTVEEGLKAGANLFLTKPCDIDVLLSSVKSLLANPEYYE